MNLSFYDDINGDLEQLMIDIECTFTSTDLYWTRKDGCWWLYSYTQDEYTEPLYCII